MEISQQQFRNLCLAFSKVTLNQRVVYICENNQIKKHLFASSLKTLMGSFNSEINSDTYEIYLFGGSIRFISEDDYKNNCAFYTRGVYNVFYDWVNL